MALVVVEVEIGAELELEVLEVVLGQGTKSYHETVHKIWVKTF